MTCYDCIHCERCSNIESGYSCHCSDVSKCKYFKNKADFVEAKQGHWYKHNKKTHGDTCWHCSVCEKMAPSDCMIWEFTDYCPHCGAKMDRKRKER